MYIQAVSRDHGTSKEPEMSVCFEKTNIRFISKNLFLEIITIYCNLTLMTLDILIIL